MSDVWMQYATPTVQLLGALAISSRVPWRSHPALIVYLVTQSLWYALRAYGVFTLPWSLPIQLVVMTAVAFEVAKFARLRVSPEVRGRIVGGVLIACTMAAGVPHMSAAQHLYLFRQYYLLSLFLALCGLVVARLWHPMIECRRHRIYRVGMAASAGVLAGASCFIKGGIGYAVFPYTMGTWVVVNFASHATLMVVVGWMALSMVGAWSKVPATVVRALWLVVRDVRRQGQTVSRMNRKAA